MIILYLHDQINLAFDNFWHVNYYDLLSVRLMQFFCFKLIDKIVTFNSRASAMWYLYCLWTQFYDMFNSSSATNTIMLQEFTKCLSFKTHHKHVKYLFKCSNKIFVTHLFLMFLIALFIFKKFWFRCDYNFQFIFSPFLIYHWIWTHAFCHLCSEVFEFLLYTFLL